MVKRERIAEILRQRLAAGDYALRPFPAERDLAGELGASYLTARKAVLQLIGEGLLVRSGRGRAAPAPASGSGGPSLALLTYGWPSRGLLAVERAFAAATAAVGIPGRLRRFQHWDDPILAETLARSSGTLLMPPAEDPGPAAAAMLRECRSRLAMTGAAGAVLGLPGIDPLPPQAMRLGLDHLHSLGHRHLGVVNTQPHDHAIRARLAEVRVWARAHDDTRVTVEDRAVPAGSDALAPARAAAAALLAPGDRPTAVLATTLPAAMGTVRAAADRGLAVGGGDGLRGERLAVAALGDEELADLLTPSITTVDGAGLEEAIAMAVGWLAGGVWAGPQAIACRPLLTIRESSCRIPPDG